MRTGADYTSVTMTRRDINPWVIRIALFCQGIEQSLLEASEAAITHDEDNIACLDECEQVRQ